MIKVLARSIREFKKASILTPRLVTVEVILECAIPFVQSGNFLVFLYFQFPGIHIDQYVRMVAMQATASIVRIHSQKNIRVTQGVNSFQTVCFHLSLF